MKKTGSLILALMMGALLACGSGGGAGKITLSLATDSKLENLNGVFSGNPAAQPDVLSVIPDTAILEVSVFGNGSIDGQNLVYNNFIPVDASTSEFIEFDVPVGDNMIFVVNAINGIGAVSYTGKSDPINISAGDDVAVEVVMAVTSNVPEQSIFPLTLNLEPVDFQTAGISFDTDLASLNTGLGTTNFTVHANIYTQAEDTELGWVPSNPANWASDPNIKFTQNPGGSEGSNAWTGGKYLKNAIQIITVDVEDPTDGGVALYGILIYNSIFNTGTPKVIMQHAATIDITLTPDVSNLVQMPTTVSAVMFTVDPVTNLIVGTGPGQTLYQTGTRNSSITVGADGHIIVDAPSGRPWLFPGGTTHINNRVIRIRSLSGPGPACGNQDIPTPIHWGKNNKTVILLNMS